MTSAEHMKMKWTDFPATNSAVHMLNCAVPYVCKSNILEFLVFSLWHALVTFLLMNMIIYWQPPNYTSINSLVSCGGYCRF